MKRLAICLIGGMLLCLSILEGCLEFSSLDGGISYEAHPVKIQYNISYGYTIDIQGTGDYSIVYSCDYPNAWYHGTLTAAPLYTSDYEEKNQGNNTVLSWEIRDRGTAFYQLGISAEVISESYLMSDMTGTYALMVDNIARKYPLLSHQYCQEQIVGSIRYIDPFDPGIKKVALTVKNALGTNNSFLLAKELFLWLKKETTYTIHTDGNGSVQPANLTLQLKTGDCDDLSFLYVSLCRSLGIPARFVRGYLLQDAAGNYSAVAHAWVEVFVGGGLGDRGWIPVECSCPSTDSLIQLYQNFGVESAGHLRVFTDEGSSSSLNWSLSGPRAEFHPEMNVEMTPFVEIESYKVLASKELYISAEGERFYR
jgi:hypothetical protein